MGDRCGLTLIARRSDLEAVEEAFGGGAALESSRKEPALVELYFEEVNYGGTTELDELDQLNVPYYGNHSEGDNYNACVFCSLSGERVEVFSVDCLPAATVGKGMVINKDDMELIELYYEKLSDVQQAIKEGASHD